MKNNKLKRCILSNSENWNEETMKLSQVASNSNLNNQFWNSLKETINMQKESETIKGRIVTAKRILTPIIQELMKDALEQIEAEPSEDAEENMDLNRKEIKVLYNNLKAADIWHVQNEVVADGEEWAMRILREISRDFEQPFDELHDRVEMNNDEEQYSKDILLNKKLLTKLVAIHQHLGNIIERLNERCRKKSIADTDDSLNDLPHQKINIQASSSTDTRSTHEKLDKRKSSQCYVNSFGISKSKVGYPTQKRDLALGENRIQLKVEHACSVINIGNMDRAAISKKLLYDVAVSFHALFEENKNNAGNKEIVIKCLADLEKVRTYLEAMRDNKECEKPKFYDLESCKNEECLESQPHLHSNLHNMPMILKLNKHAENNERNSDLVIGIPSLNRNSPNVHILLNTNQQYDIKRAMEQDGRSRTQPKNPNRVSRIPKPINKKRIDVEKFVKTKSMKITLENKESSHSRTANLLIFDPDDPCKSIIKMKEQKNKVVSGSRPVVSNASFSLTQHGHLIIYLIFCCIGGKYNTLNANIGIYLLFKGSLKSSESAFCLSMELHVFIFIFRISLSLADHKRKYLISKVSGEKYFCFKRKNFWRNESKSIDFSYDGNLNNYKQHLLSLISLIKGSVDSNFDDKNILYKKYILQQKDFKEYQPRTKIHYIVYFFQCFKEIRKTGSCGSLPQKRWNYQSLNSAAYPIWTIKRSKYYSVPQSRKKEDEVVLNKRVEEYQENKDQLTFKLVDSLENLKESNNEIHLQISEVSLRSAELTKIGELETGSDKMCQKTEIKRKVSFRDEVDISEPAVDMSVEDPDQDDNHLPVTYDYEQHHSNDVEYIVERSPSLHMQDDIEELSTRISDLLMTDSLMQLAEDVPTEDTKRPKRASNKSSLNSLKLTDSARHVLAKLSKSFEDARYGSISDIMESDIVPYFHDERGNPITEIYNSDGDLLINLKNNNVDRLASVLFDFRGKLLRNRYDVNGRRIKAVYDENGRLVSCISESNERVQADLEFVQYYDYKSKPIKHLYDSSGYEIKTIGKDLTSKIFDADGRLQMDIYTRRGKRIDAVYDSCGRLLGRVSYSRLKPLLRREQVRVANIDSLKKLFESESKSIKLQYEDTTEQNKSLKRLFDQEGNPLIGVYDKKGKPIKLTSSGEADELLPFLFDNKGKLHAKRYDSKGKELKAVFGEDGKAISEMSMAWLNDLLAISRNNIPKIKKKESIFKKISRHKTKTEKPHDIEKLYDSKGRIITSVFDSKGKPLAISLSGDAGKLLPFLFDKNGKFIRKRYDLDKRKLTCVYGKDGNIISTISVTYLNKVAAKVVTNQDRKEYEDNARMEENFKTDPGKDSQEIEGKMVENTESNKSIDYCEKVPDQIYDGDGNILTEIFDDDSNLLGRSPSGNAWKLLPQLFDDKGLFLKGRFDNHGRELLAVYNKEGDDLNDDLSTAIKIAAVKTLEFSNSNKEIKDSNEKKVHMENTEECKCEEVSKVNEIYGRNSTTNDCELNKNQNYDKTEQKASALKLANTQSKAPPAASPKTSSKLGATAKKSNTSKHAKLKLQKEKYEKKQVQPTTSKTVKQSTNQKFDIPEITLKAGESIYRFHDERGNVITEVYDAKGKVLIKTVAGEVQKLAKFLFDKHGFLYKNVYNQKGRRITRIFDQKNRTVSRISVPSGSTIISGVDIPNKKARKLPGSVYDKEGFLVKKIYDKTGHPIIITKHAKLQDLAPIIFDEKGVRRRIYNESGYEIGPIYDHKGNVLKRSPIFRKSKPKQDGKGSWIVSKSGKTLRNFYDSDGTLIIALYNDYGKALFDVKKGVNNARFLSKFFFDKDGNFLRGRFYNYKGQIIKHVYDSDGNIVQTIKRTESRKIAHHKSTNRKRDKVSLRRNNENANRLNLRMNLNGISRNKHREYHGNSEISPVENIMGMSSSQSDTILNNEVTSLQRSMSTYSIKDCNTTNELSASVSSLTNMPVKKFYDEDGRLLTGVYNSKNRLLGYSASGNARVLAPYLFDNKGNFISGRYHLDRKPLQHVYDSNGKLVDKISKLVLRKRESKGLKINDVNEDVITSICDQHGKEILDVTDSGDEIGNLLDENGKFKKNLCNSELKFHKHLDFIRKKSVHEVSLFEKRGQKELGLRDRISALSNFKDKILTVIFDNQHRIRNKISFRASQKKTKNKETRRSDDQYRLESTKSHLYDGNFSIIKDIHDNRGKLIDRVYNSSGRVISELYSASGTLLKNNVLRSMFEEHVFKPKAYNSEGDIITEIFANKKLLKKVYDENGAPAKIDSDLIYLVSNQSLPGDDVSPPLKPTPKHVNYFSEGSAYPFPERQNQNGKIQNQQLRKKGNYETELEVAFNGYSSRRTDNCVCEHCQKTGKNRKNIIQFGGELLDRLSRFTIPLTKFLPRNFLRREVHDDSEEPEGERDSLETLIDETRQQSEEGDETDREYYGSCSRVSLLESDENIPISRKMVEKTLKKCVHLNSSTKVVGKVSDTVLQHFANLILQEIEQKFYHKLDVLQCGRRCSLMFECVGEKDICVGTELKFEDSLIGKHISAQTSDASIGLDNCCHLCGSSLRILTRNLEQYGYFNGDLSNSVREFHKAFVCKVPNLQPFIMTMNTRMKLFEKSTGEG